jgi:hypothetical protein
MIARIPATVNTHAAAAQVGSTRAFTAGEGSDYSATAGSSTPSVVVSDRLDKLAERFGFSTDGVTGATSAVSSGAWGRVDSSELGASEPRYSSSEDRGANGVARQASSASTGETIEGVLTDLRRMGQDAIRAQANQLPHPGLS